jgi:hypothetical protein
MILIKIYINTNMKFLILLNLFLFCFSKYYIKIDVDGLFNLNHKRYDQTKTYETLQLYCSYFGIKKQKGNICFYT